MTKYFLITLLGLTTFLSPTQAQDTTVHITPSTARYFLEIDDEVHILREKDSICNDLVYNLSSEIKLKNLIIQSFQNDTLIYSARETALKDNIKWLDRDLDLAEHEIKRQKVLKFIIMGVAGGALILLN